MIDPTTDNIICDVCGKDCGYYNHNGDGGHDRSGTWRDLCEACNIKYQIMSCIECENLTPFSLLNNDCVCKLCAEKLEEIK